MDILHSFIVSLYWEVYVTLVITAFLFPIQLAK